MIEVAGLEKEYGGFTAVGGNSFEVASGEVFGIVGPNGAGKTTTLKMLAGLIEPTVGTVRVNGANPRLPSTRERIGFLPEESPLYEEMTPRSYLRFFADLYDVDRATANQRIDQTLDRLQLAHRDRPIGDMSKGMSRKVAIARALINDPEVLIFDEPASGLDPRTTHYINEFVQELGADGKTVLFSAHNLYHVESVCDRVAIMNNGQIVTRGTIAEIREQYGQPEYHVYTSVPVPGSTEVNGRHRQVVAEWSEIIAIREAAQEAGGDITDVRTRGESLEEIFLTVAGEADS